ncbi:MAG: type 4a pilus biogenesis protein PilO [Candidatus Omnitrophica bacterium]|nr:type 4a pilus biogenesis protein PilO [Candidatus Omnitrophota bacterium]
MEITKDKLIKIIAGTVVIVVIGTYLFLYRPLMSKLKKQHSECRAIESEVEQAQEAITTLKKKDKKTLLNEADVSVAIDELTKQAKSKGLNLISITPKQVNPVRELLSGSGAFSNGVKEKEALYKILPIEMEMESTYEDLGIFLGSLDKLEKSLATIDSFSVISDKERSLNLKTKLVVNMYLASGEHAE